MRFFSVASKGIITLAWCCSFTIYAATFTPLTVADLIANINTANTNGVNDTIDLGNLTFNLTLVDNTSILGPNGLPVILADFAGVNHSITFENGVIQRSLVGGTPNFRIFQVAAGATLNLNGVRLFNGNPGAGLSGGAILVTGDGTLGTVNNSVFLANTALLDGGAIAFLLGANGGSIIDSTFTNNNATGVGGAISLLASNLNLISDSTFNNNTSTGAGGAIAVVISVLTPAAIDTIRNSTFSDNSTLADGGAIVAIGSVLNPSTIGNISNTTIAGNSALVAGGGLSLGAFGTISNLESSIIATNIAALGPDIFDFLPKATEKMGVRFISEENFNLIGDNRGSGIPASTTTTSQNGGLSSNSFVGDGTPITGIGVIDPLLGVLQNNGGSTETREPSIASLAIDNGSNPLSLPFDQRGDGFLRVRGSDADIGAVELQICLDIDDDSICDDVDNCPLDANSDQSDADADGLGDVCDDCPNDFFNDADDDTICGNLDNCPFFANTSQLDTDGDDIGDACDICPIGENDADEDDDGICDALDSCPDYDDAIDVDADGVVDGCDNCPADANTSQEDTDHDGIGDGCDTCLDVDEDGVGEGEGDTTCEVSNGPDNCPFLNNPSQADPDDDGLGTPCDICPNDPSNTCTADDVDGDGIINSADNCIAVPNAADIDPGTPGIQQADTDNDGLGDSCDPCPEGAQNVDADGDQIPDACDFCIDDPTNTCTEALADDDDDDVPNNWDNCPVVANPDQEDHDNDGIGDACDTCTDLDGDGFGDPGFTSTGCTGSTSEVDNCPFFSNPDQDDLDNDDIGDRCDTIPAGATPLVPPPPPILPPPGLIGGPGPLDKAPKADIPVTDKAPSTEIKLPKKSATAKPTPAPVKDDLAPVFDEEAEESAGCSTTGGTSSSSLILFVVALWSLRAQRRKNEA